MQSHTHLTTLSPERPQKPQRFVCLGLVALADILLYDVSLGLNVFLFALSVVIALMLWPARPLRRGPPIEFVGLTAVASLPLLAAPTAAAIFLSIISVACSCLAAAGLLPRDLSALPSVLWRFFRAIPWRLLKESPGLISLPLRRVAVPSLARRLVGWLVPLALSVAFLWLFQQANPVVEAILRAIDLSFLLQFFNAWRLTFWLVVGASVWMLMKPRLGRRKARVQTSTGRVEGLVETFFDHRSLVRSLVIFNALFAFQTVTDIMYLWGGMALPQGMNHAEYAHRGAYPLLATALLAAAFVLVAMRRDGPGNRSPLIRNLVLFWIGQNVLLCLSSLLRLELYVEAYSLTWLRVMAGVWMGLVASGLVLIVLRILFRRSNRWLVAMNLMVLTLVAYGGALVDVPAMIARFNVDHCAEVDQTGVPLDIWYIGSLGPSAIPAIDVYLSKLANTDYDKRQKANRARELLVAEFSDRKSDWRGWNYRAARLTEYLNATIPFAS